MRHALLRPPFRSRVLQHAGLFDDDRQPYFDGEVPAELLVAFGRGAQLVIEVSQRDHPKVAVLTEVEQEVRQRNRVGASRHAHHDRSATWEEAVASNRSTNLLEEGGHVRSKDRSAPGSSLRAGSKPEVIQKVRLRRCAASARQPPPVWLVRVRPASFGACLAVAHAKRERRLVPEGGLEPPTPRL